MWVFGLSGYICLIKEDLRGIQNAPNLFGVIEIFSIFLVFILKMKLKNNVRLNFTTKTTKYRLQLSDQCFRSFFWDYFRNKIFIERDLEKICDNLSSIGYGRR
jgi:hypothetical protein